MTADQLTARILLSNASPATKQRAVGTVARQVRHQLGEECPECGGTQIEWNGHDGSDAGYRCVACDHRFGPDYDA